MCKYSLEDCHRLARNRGGICVSTKINTVTDRLLWRCSLGHTWSQQFRKIRSGHWCKKCAIIKHAKNRKQTIEHMRELAHSRNGKCLSIEYTDSKTHLKWKCNCGYVWLARPAFIKRGTWCPRCAHRIAYTKMDLDNLATTRGGVCLSSDYHSAKTYYDWKCSKGHLFRSTWDSVQAGTWCPKCAGQLRTICDMQKHAQQKGGLCLSKTFVKMQDKLLWQCSSGHQWTATAASVWKGSWCPKCNGHYTEERCRFIIESLTGHEFPKTLISVNDPALFFKRSMELDGYCKSLDVAIEHHGVQHYQYVSLFHGTVDQFHLAQQKDRRKEEICLERGIRLIIIPSRVSDQGDKELIRFILKQLCKHNIPAKGKVDFAKFYVLSPLEKLRKIATQHGGICLSESYVGPHNKVKWRCASGHEWMATPSSVKNNRTWCPYCGLKKSGQNRRTHTLEEMQQIARGHGGECLSIEYLGTHKKLEWKCRRGHTWKSLAMSVLRGYWCRYCAHSKQELPL